MLSFLQAAEAEILLRGEDLTPDALDRAALEARMREERERALKLQQFESQLEAQRKEVGWCGFCCFCLSI